jgi:GrpB-like predicted nucleotidyltransferase (UPF0157 family)
MSSGPSVYPSPVPPTGNDAARPVVAPYRAGWPVRASALIDQLSDALGPVARRIEHIGSTAIPGMDAKDVLDMQVSVSDLDLATTAFDGPLAVLGFKRSPYEHDHVPAGRPDDPGRWAKRLWARRAPQAVNLHVRLVGSPNERVALLFRDWFRAHPDAVPAYARFKHTLAGVTTTTSTYADVKDPVVDLVIGVAEGWAAEVGWTP